MRYSWASNEGERDEWISFARRIEGMELSRVRYYDIDYRRHEVAPNHSGPRVIEVEAECAEPSWEFPGGHTVDYGVEFVGRAGQVWSLTWIPPGLMEGLALDDHPMFTDAVVPEAAVAIWDVSKSSKWQPLIGETVQSVRASFEPWDDSGIYWCRRIALDFPHASVELLEAEGVEDGTLTPSADNIVVLFEER